MRPDRSGWALGLEGRSSADGRHRGGSGVGARDGGKRDVAGRVGEPRGGVGGGRGRRNERGPRVEGDGSDVLREVPRRGRKIDFVADIVELGGRRGKPDIGQEGRRRMAERRRGNRLRYAVRARPRETESGRAIAVEVADSDRMSARGERNRGFASTPDVTRRIGKYGRAVEPQVGSIIGREYERIVARFGDEQDAGEASGEKITKTRIGYAPAGLRERKINRGGVRRQIGGKRIEIGQRVEPVSDQMECHEKSRFFVGQQLRSGRRTGRTSIARVRRDECDREDNERGVVEREEVGVRLDVVARRDQRPVRVVVRLGGEARGAAGGGIRDDGFVRGGVLERERGAVAHGGEPRGGVRGRRRDGHGADVLRDDGCGRQRGRLGVAE